MGAAGRSDYPGARDPVRVFERGAGSRAAVWVLGLPLALVARCAKRELLLVKGRDRWPMLWWWATVLVPWGGFGLHTAAARLLLGVQAATAKFVVYTQ